MSPLPTGATIGILGGGQLGRMLSVAAARLGFRTHIFEPGANPPAADVAHAVTTAGYDDHKALEAFARACDIVTFEFENIPTEALDVVALLDLLRKGEDVLGRPIYTDEQMSTYLSQFEVDFAEDVARS